jgi:hypothetical protein
VAENWCCRRRVILLVRLRQRVELVRIADRVDGVDAVTAYVEDHRCERPARQVDDEARLAVDACRLRVAVGRYEALYNALMARRVTMVVRYACGERTSVSGAPSQRTYASWSTSSASITLPSMR